MWVMESSAKITHNQPKSPKKTESPRDFAGEESRGLHAVADQLWDAWTKRPQKTHGFLFDLEVSPTFSLKAMPGGCVYIYYSGPDHQKGGCDVNWPSQ